MTIFERAKKLLWCYYEAIFYIDNELAYTKNLTPEQKTELKKRSEKLYIQANTAGEILSNHYKIKEKIISQAATDAWERYKKQYNITDWDQIRDF